jgi:hypothetical protein
MKAHRRADRLEAGTIGDLNSTPGRRPARRGERPAGSSSSCSRRSEGRLGLHLPRVDDAQDPHEARHRAAGQVVILDMEAGISTSAGARARPVDAMLVVIEPGCSVQTARQIQQLATDLKVSASPRAQQVRDEAEEVLHRTSRLPVIRGGARARTIRGTGPGRRSASDLGPAFVAESRASGIGLSRKRTGQLTRTSTTRRNDHAYYRRRSTSCPRRSGRP